LAIAIGTGSAAVAQQDCAARLAEAEQAYAIGQFERVPVLLADCLARLRGADARDARALIAKTLVVTDRLDEASEAVRELVLLYPDYSTSFRDPLLFVQMVDARRQAGRALTVTSVSKTEERLVEAPATVMVVTAAEIARRGYLDLEQLLHDLPGFDISRGNGVVYSNAYQRGYRSAGNDRMLLLIDGVEENDLWSNIAYLSRQYSLSNIDRVEVVYGPASTIYGANAFTGVINVVTKDARALLQGDRLIGVTADVGGGTWSTGWVDTTLAARNRSDSLALTVTARVYTSDERDLSGFSEWDYDPAFYDAYDYASGLAVGPEDATGLPDPDSSPLLQRTPDGGVTVSAAGAALARGWDKAAIQRELNGHPVAFSDRTEDWTVAARLRLGKALFGVQAWRREEGFNTWYTDNFYAGADNGVLWIPRATHAYFKYGTDIGRGLHLRLFSRFKRHELADGTGEQQIRNYSSGRLGLADLVAGTASYWQTTFYDQTSQQFRNELTLDWEPIAALSVLAGVEARQSSIQGDYVLQIFATDDPSNVVRDDRADNALQVFDQLDLGVYAQAAYRPRRDLKLVAGGRWDHNSVDGRTDDAASGYGGVFNPRLAVVYSPSNWVFKAIYAEAFKDASNFNRYATAPGIRELQNPDLKPEKVRNLELAAAWQPRDELSVELAAYQARYSDAVAARRVPYEDGTTLQNQSLGSLEVFGVQSTAAWRWRDLECWANYTYTDPRNTNPLDGSGSPRTDADGNPLSEVRVGDIAAHRFNLGGTYTVLDRLDLHLRINYVGARETGADTSVFSSPLDRIDAYTAVHATVRYRDLLPGLDVQLVLENLLDANSEHPGVRAADGRVFASRLPQNDRAAFLRAVYRY
jgi:outer membrane receptor protein involved in Fe transport